MRYSVRWQEPDWSRPKNSRLMTRQKAISRARYLKIHDKIALVWIQSECGHKERI